MGIKKKISIGILSLFCAVMLLFTGEIFTMPHSSKLPLSAQNNKTANQVGDTIFISPPMGEQEVDRRNIQAAFDAVQPGGTIQFASGTYYLGPGARLSVPDVTVLGHSEGTILRGCDPEAFDVEEEELASVVFGCTGIYIQAERQTIRGFTFENIWHALVVGPYPTSQEEAAGFWSSENEPEFYPSGGQLIENNIFRSVANGLRMLGTGKELSIIRNNDFIDVFHAIGMYGGPTHFLENRVKVENPESVPFSRHPGSAILVSPGHTDCSGHVVAENIIQGYPDPIYVNADRGQICQDVKIVENIIHTSRVKIPEAWVYKPTAEDSTMVGTPITLMNYREPMPGMPESDTIGVLKNILVRGNKIMGAEGLGILVQDVTESVIADNTILGIKRRTPFPGITWDGIEPEWEKANGSGIWLSPGSNGNEISGNILEDIAAVEVFIEGDSNRVDFTDNRDSIHDMGINNIIIQSVVAADTTRYTIIVDGHRKAERLQWKEGPNTWGYEYRGNSYDSYHFPRTERLVLDAEGYPVKMEISGQRIFWDQWIEQYERNNGLAEWTAHTQSSLGPEWSRTLDEGQAEITKPVYYAAVHPVHDLSVLARLLLNDPDKKLPLLPEGNAQLELINEKVVETDKDQRKLSLYAIHGLDFRPQYVWLDDKNATFADEWSVLAGWEEAFPELRATVEDALATYHFELVKDLIPPARKKPLVIHGAKLFDPETQSVNSGITVLIEGNRIAAVGPDGTLKTPPEAEVIDAAGKMILPGLWDMHSHHGISETYLELMAPLYFAGGITTARDLGSPTDPMLSLRRRIESGEALGPRLLLAGWVEGGIGRPTGPLVNNAAEARAAVDRFAELGYVQVKIYSALPRDLVEVVIKRAEKHGMRVSGHVPQGMSTREAVEMGYDEIQHLDDLMYRLISDLMADFGADPTAEKLDKLYGAFAELTTDSEKVQELIKLLKSNNIAIDPTLAVMDAQQMKPEPWVKRSAERFPPVAQRRILDLYLFGYWPLNALWEDIFENMKDIVRGMHNEGISILPGSDMEIAGFSLHRELEIYNEAGIPAPEVLSLATLGAARIMGMDKELGSIEPGKLADLILIDGNPIENIGDIRRVVTVVKDGRVYDPAAIYKALGIEPCCEE